MLWAFLLLFMHAPPAGCWVSGASVNDTIQYISGAYIAVEWMDTRRILMRAPAGSTLPAVDDEIMLDELEQWKWRVELAAANAAVLVTTSHCPHGLGHLPASLTWRGGGMWRPWPGTFEYSRGMLNADTFAIRSWASISHSAACEGSPGIKILGHKMGLDSVDSCQTACAGVHGCRAIDYYRKTKWCQFYDAACDSPPSTHDGASSWRAVPEAELKASGQPKRELTFTEAKKWCQEDESCTGFSYMEAWSDKERETAVPRSVTFSKSPPRAGSGKGHSYIRKDNPRAQCNPEGKEFECPSSPYACLGLSMDADDNAIKQAYRALSKKMHPDKVVDRSSDSIKQAEAAFRDISESNENLRDVHKRRQIDMKLRQQRQMWEKNKANVQDLYIKESSISSLEPESYPVLIPKAQEWLVHFFLPSNDGCKQMKMAMGRVVADLGTGEEERDVPAKPRRIAAGPVFMPGDVFRGRIRQKGSGLRNEGAKPQEGDLYMVLVVYNENRATIYTAVDETNVTISADPSNTQQTHLREKEHTFTGKFDRNRDYFRGTLAETDKLKVDIASFVLVRDTWQDPPANPERGAKPGGGRQKPRLFGAVNCGRFPDFCKKKGADPSKTKLFPQVRMLFPDEVRYEVYHGKPLGRDLGAFAREASRPHGELFGPLNMTFVAGLREQPVEPWLVLLRKDLAKGKGVPDCPICGNVLPMMRRTAPRMASAGIKSGWVNCSGSEDLCTALAGGEEPAGELAAWGALRLVEFGGGRGPGGPPPTATPAPAADEESQPPVVETPRNWASLWNTQLLPGDMSQQSLLVGLEFASRMADFIASTRAAGSAESGAHTAGAKTARNDEL